MPSFSTLVFQERTLFCLSRWPFPPFRVHPFLFSVSLLILCDLTWSTDSSLSCDFRCLVEARCIPSLSFLHGLKFFFSSVDIATRASFLPRFGTGPFLLVMVLACPHYTFARHFFLVANVWACRSFFDFCTFFLASTVSFFPTHPPLFPYSKPRWHRPFPLQSVPFLPRIVLLLRSRPPQRRGSRPDFEPHL